ncbi:polyphosphate kinase 2 (PPK2) [mine drainage metagenome]|uniref:Polyphosphate kinase 2 (PPK2) n=1 Tax=mine drainage metagenome TaxID=410659 RepID=A0A1J5QR14_9ZZZZ
MSTSERWPAPASKVLRPGPGFRFAAADAGGTPGWRGDKDDVEDHLAERSARLSDLQERLYAHGRSGGRRSVLLVLQGMDTAGKGGIVRHVVGLVDPGGVRHTSFGVPTATEREHHFLWRIRNALPAPGYLGVFDRSHYEDVLVARVHGLVPPDVWEARYDEINAFERSIAEAGTVMVKVALVVSLDEQRARLRERLDRPDKRWKYNPDDLDERVLWPVYQQAYQAVLDRTSTDVAPWHVVPADKKWFARLAVTELLTESLESLDLDWPPAHFDVAAETTRLAELRP